MVKSFFHLQTIIEVNPRFLIFCKCINTAFVTELETSVIILLFCYHFQMIEKKRLGMERTRSAFRYEHEKPMRSFL